MTTVYRKSAKGLAEIDTRAHRLLPRLRTALILVDGHRTDDELRTLIPQQADETLTALLGQGFIEVITVFAPLRPRPAAPAVPSVAPVLSSAGPVSSLPGGTQPLEQLRREAVRAFTEQVGPMAEALAIKMEKARTAEQLAALLETARQIVGNTRGAAAAEAFSARFLQGRPTEF